ncbi:MAG TPA: ATP-binding protein, partial [Accumulibacter sp.]|nr:ATP-binding protein [Accumulibacter sp.]
MQVKITAIKTANFIGARNVDVKLSKPICLFAVKNFSGKSSLQEAVRMALTGESVLVSLNKYYRKLVTEGTEYGFSVDELIASKRAEIYAGIDEKWRKTSFDEKEIIGSNTAQKKVLARAGWAML